MRQTTGNAVRLTSWNVLADSYIRASFYPRTDARLLREGARTSGILELLANDPSDMFCLQEVEPALVTAARARFGDWQIHHAPKRGKPDGVALLARPDVELDEVGSLAFSDGAPDREDSGHVALLATVRIGQLRVRLATTHLRWDPPGTPHDQRWATREVRQLAGLATPAIVCGDLNFEPDDEACRMLLAAGLVDAHASNGQPTANPNARAKRIDYILCTPDLRVTPIATRRIDDATVLPSADMPSDHVPIAVELTAVE